MSDPVRLFIGNAVVENNNAEKKLAAKYVGCFKLFTAEMN
jgi:hypothetical protein